MSAYVEGIASAPNAVDAMFQVLRAHLVANGWTEHDVISNTANNRNVVFRGGALDATADVRPFLQIQSVSSVLLGFTGYADYDTATHTGIASCGGTANAGIGISVDFSSPYIFRFDSMGGIICMRSGGSWNRAYLGFAYRGMESDEIGITKATGSLTAGATSISVASDMTGKLRVGQKVHVMNYAHNSASANAAKCEIVTISSVAAGSIGVSALANNYDSGAVIGENVCPLVVANGGNTAGSLGASTLYVPYNYDGSRTGLTGQTAVATACPIPRTAETDPTDGTPARFGTGIFAFAAATSAKLDFKGYPRGGVFNIAGGGLGGGTSFDELLSDGAGNSYFPLDPGTSTVTIVGPRET